MTPAPQVVLTAGAVVTMTGQDADAVVLDRGRIAFVGARHLAAERFREAPVIDYGTDATILPGFHDAHSHPEIVAENALHVDLVRLPPDDHTAITAALAERARVVGPGKWVRAVGFRPSQGTQQRVIDARLLDQVCPANPVYITHVSSHWGVANSRALELLGIAPGPGRDRHGLGIDANGSLTGALFEQRHFDAVFPALASAQPLCPRAPEVDIARNLQALFHEYSALGITSTVDALGWPGSFDLYEQLAATGRSPVRVGMLISHHHLAAAAGLRARCTNDRLRVVGIKMFADGALSGGTCLLDEPYAHADDYSGDEVLGPDQLVREMRSAIESGFWPAVHANGDRAVHQVISAFEQLQPLAESSGVRLRIEHCSLVRPDDVARLARIKAIPVLFGTFISAHGDLLLNLYGPQRAQRLIAARSLLAASLDVAASSDSPAAPVPPLQGVQDLVTRTSPSGRVVGEGQSVSVTEALGLYTVGAARAVGMADRLGRVHAGFLGDLVVLGRDPRRVEPHEISAIDVLATWVDGTCVWSGNGRMPAEHMH